MIAAAGPDPERPTRRRSGLSAAGMRLPHGNLYQDEDVEPFIPRQCNGEAS